MYEEEEIPLEDMNIVDLQESIEDIIQKAMFAESSEDMKTFKKKYRELAKTYNEKVKWECYKLYI